MRANIRDFFPVVNKAIYLNHAAIGPSPKPVTDETQKWMVHHKTYGDMYFSPLSQMYEDLNEDRDIVGKLINAQAPRDEISFTYNTSYGLAAIAEAIPWEEGDTIILNYLEYTSNSYTYQALARKFNLKIKTIPHINGVLPLDKFQAALDQTTRLVAISHVQFSNGFRTDLETLTSMVHEVGGEIIVDGIQSLGAIPLDVQKTNIDYLAAGGYKWLLAPLGTGFLYVRKDLAEHLQPSLIGSMSDATPMNLSHHHYVPGPAAKRFQASLGPNATLLAVAVKFLLDIGIDNIFKHLLNLTDIIIEFIQNTPNFELNSPVNDIKNRSGIINFKCPHAEEIVTRLRKLDKPIAVSYREKGIRVSPHCYNTEEEVKTCLETISQLSSQL
ncbi:MAG: aminotransferase class V-fold PLP-dependent enzyme [Candidatus Hodarchaeales archaeon]|jgi:selenocysteine lyase/cysteine desulfurase